MTLLFITKCPTLVHEECIRNRNTRREDIGGEERPLQYFHAECENAEVDEGVREAGRRELRELCNVQGKLLRTDAENREEALQNFPKRHVRCPAPAIREDDRDFR